MDKVASTASFVYEQLLASVTPVLEHGSRQQVTRFCLIPIFAFVLIDMLPIQEHSIPCVELYVMRLTAYVLQWFTSVD